MLKRLVNGLFFKRSFKMDRYPTPQVIPCKRSFEIDRTMYPTPTGLPKSDANDAFPKRARPQGFDSFRYADSIAKEVASGARELHGCPWWAGLRFSLLAFGMQKRGGK